MKNFTIAVMPGDGIGREVVPPCFDLLCDAVKKVGDIALQSVTLDAGADLYLRTGEAFPEEAFQEAARADAILLGAMGLPSIRYADGREIAPQLELRERLDLYAGVRPVKAYAGVPPVLAAQDFAKTDFVLVRESTEGLFTFRTKGTVNGDVAQEVLQLTRKGCERIYDFSFKLARKRKSKGHKGMITCVDKANVFRSFKYARDLFDARAQLYPDITIDHCYVDAMAMNMVKCPWRYDVMVMENQFGDILSDLGAGIMGGLGMAPSADIGDSHAVFQPCHGSAPDIMGQDKANPIATFLSGALMLDWLADKHGVPALERAATLVETAVERALASGAIRSYEFGGTSGTRAITDCIRNTLALL